jgi:hypothetical protein
VHLSRSGTKRWNARLIGYEIKRASSASFFRACSRSPEFRKSSPKKGEEFISLKVHFCDI